MAQLEEAFSLFDKDGDGTISIDEIEIVMKVRVRRTSMKFSTRQNMAVEFPLKAFGGNPTHEEIETQLKTIDLDGDGTVDYPEFLS